jgi:RNA polymerase sigma factor (sigma-70 family)
MDGTAVQGWVVAGSDDRALVERAYATRAGQLWSYARRLGLTAGDAEDVMQEAFSRALESSVRIQNLDSWLFQVVHNLSVDRYRAASRVAGVAPVAHQLSSNERLTLWELVDQLPRTQRAVLYLRYRADLDFTSVAQILGMSEGGARAAASRALARLRQVAGDQ